MEPRTAYLLRVCGFILLVEVLERQAYYGLSADLQIYLTDVLGLTTSEATSNVSAPGRNVKLGHARGSCCMVVA